MRIPVIAWIGLGALVLSLVGRKSATAVGQQGRISSLSIDGAPMGAHRVSKNPGQSAVVTVQWTGATKDFQGNGITWPYVVVVSLQPSGGAVGISHAFSIPVNAPFLVAQTSQLSVLIPASAVSGQVYDVTAVLQAAQSDASGSPSSTIFVNIRGVDLTHASAIVIAPQEGPALPQGAIGTVDVAQAILRQMRS